MAAYVDASVVLAWLFEEQHRPEDSFWSEPLYASRLTEYETWTRLHARGLGVVHRDRATNLLSQFSWLELSPGVLARVLEPFPIPLRTLDALHLASADWLRREGFVVEFATYDARLRQAALVMGFSVVEVA
jgi:predicted nucleic acid-binding protein